MKPKTAKISKKPRRASKVNSGLHAVYFYYLDRGGEWEVYEWWDPGKPIDLESAIIHLADNAQGSKNNPPYYTKDLSLVRMRRQSYVAFAVSAQDWTLGLSNEIKVTGNDDFGHPISNGAYTFANTVTHPSLVGKPTAPLLVVYFENAMMSVRGGQLADREFETFRFELPFFAQRKKRVRAPDSGGTNMGPPVPPPFRLRKKRKPKSAR